MAELTLLKTGSLQSGAVVRHPPDPVHSDLNLLLADGVVAARIVVCRVLLTRDQLLRVEQLAVSTCTQGVWIAVSINWLN